MFNRSSSREFKVDGPMISGSPPTLVSLIVFTYVPLAFSERPTKSGGVDDYCTVVGKLIVSQ
jgi:hypothetical protein